MKVYLLMVLLLGSFLFEGCGQKAKPKVIVVEKNETIEVPIVLEEDAFQWKQNDEHIGSGTVAKIVVIKSRRVMVLFDEYDNVLSRHRISLGKNNIGTKLKQGDYKTPEGTYTIVRKNHDKRYYREIFLSYPNAEDRARSKSMGFHPGGGITIHAQVPWNWDGNGNDYTLGKDWTEGCMAVTNEGMDMIWDAIAIGTPIEIRE